MRRLRPAAPVGDVAPPPHSAPEFAVFVLTGSKPARGERSLRDWLSGWQWAARRLSSFQTH
jgi:hypothetical protein